jgi:hypothetical protein
MKAIRYHWLALIFALLSCLIYPLDKAIAKAYPDWASELYYSNGRLFDENTAIQSGMYRGYTVRERVRAVVSLLGFAFCLLAFFIGRAGIRGPQGKKRDICLIAATIGICSSASYAGWAVSLILFLVFMLRFQQKGEITAEQQVS